MINLTLRRVSIPSYSGWRRRSVFLIFAIGVLCALIIVQPIKRHTWNAIRTRGDDALAKRQFALAKVEYSKLHLLELTSPEPARLTMMVTNAEADITTLRPFYESRHDEAMIHLLDQATKDYPTPEEATLNCQELARASEYDLGLTCITKTTTSWPTYRDAWITQSIIAQTLGRDDLHKDALQKVKELDPNSGSSMISH